MAEVYVAYVARLSPVREVGLRLAGVHPWMRKEE